jgi:hypothetical protein
MSMALDRFCLIVSFAKPAAVELSVFIGVAGCIWPSSVSVTRVGRASCPLRNKTPILASAAEARTLPMIWHVVWTGPLRVGCSLGACFGSGGLLLKKKCPPAQLRALVADR